MLFLLFNELPCHLSFNTIKFCSYGTHTESAFSAPENRPSCTHCGPPHRDGEIILLPHDVTLGHCKSLSLSLSWSHRELSASSVLPQTFSPLHRPWIREIRGNFHHIKTLMLILPPLLQPNNTTWKLGPPTSQAHQPNPDKFQFPLDPPWTILAPYML